MPIKLEINKPASREEMLDRLDKLAARLEVDGSYTDAIICVNAYTALTSIDPPEWRKVVDAQWSIARQWDIASTGDTPGEKE